MVTCYDYWSAKIIEDSNIDCVLVGDSSSMVMHGHDSTIPASVDQICTHIKAVSKGLNKKFIVGDMPFLSFRKSLTENMTNVEKIMQAGAHAIKLEGVKGNEDLIDHIVESGVPVMGHIGLTPQFVHKFGGFKVQGRESDGEEMLMTQAKTLEDLGCFSLVLEAIPANVAKTITSNLEIPTIGIGAGVNTDGQVLVFHDMMGFQKDFKPKFLRQYFNGYEGLLTALNSFDGDVKSKDFPSEEESYS